MNRPASNLRKLGLLALALALLIGASHAQRGLNRARGELGFTRATPLKNAPPVLVLTTVVLGGFRGLIANALWVRAMELQENDKFFEMVQLADWITKLQPRMTTVWIVMAWNMSYNISIKFSDPADRWMWVRRGIELLRDEAITKYNPHEVLLYRELAWHFQHKMGHNLDDAHLYFKNAWAIEMERLFGGPKPNFEELLHPVTEEAKARLRRLREDYKMEPEAMRAVEARYGPLEWRLPETHGIYWAHVGRQMAKTKEEVITLRRVIYQSMLLAFHRGQLIENRADGTVRFAENLDLIPKVHAAYEEMIDEDLEQRDSISRAHRNFILDAIYFLYAHARQREAGFWLGKLKELYPDRYPTGMTLDDYVLMRFGEDSGETDMNRTISNVRGVLRNFYLALAYGDDDQANSYGLMARVIWQNYQRKIVNGPSEKRVGLPPLEEMRQEVLTALLDPATGLRPELAATLRTALKLPPPSPATNAPPTQR